MQYSNKRGTPVYEREGAKLVIPKHFLRNRMLFAYMYATENYHNFAIGYT